MAKRSFVVLESRWFGSEESVRPVYDLLALAEDYGPGAYVYERFVGRASLVEVLKFVIEKERAECIYLGSHGDKRGLKLPNNKKRLIAADDLRKLLFEPNTAVRPKITGIFLSACRFLTKENAKAIFGSRQNSLQWVCGYEGDPDWLDSTLFEALFFTNFFRTWKIREVSKLCKWDTNCFAKEWKFHIFVRNADTKNDLDNLANPQSVRIH